MDVLTEAVLLPLSEADIKNHLMHLDISDVSSLEVFPSLVSTNDYLGQKRFNQNSEVTVCIAEQQTHGRGRFGHHWYSPEGVNLYLSLLWPMSQWHEQYATLGLHLLTSFAEMLEKLEFTGVQLKWPNDICVQEKKLGGILIERKISNSAHNLIIGVGLNVAMSVAKQPKLENPWIDLISIKPDLEISRNELAAHVINVIINTLSKLSTDLNKDLPSKWNSYDLMYEREIEFTFNEIRNVGTALGVDELGQIIINMEGKRLHLHSAHVSDITL